MQCTNCGTPLTPGIDICPRCGTQLSYGDQAGEVAYVEYGANARTMGTTPTTPATPATLSIFLDDRIQSRKDFDQLHLLHMGFKEHCLCHFVDIINCNSTAPAANACFIFSGGASLPFSITAVEGTLKAPGM